MFGLFDRQPPRYVGVVQGRRHNTSNGGITGFLSGLFGVSHPVYERAPAQRAALAVEPVQVTACEPVQPAVCQPLQAVACQPAFQQPK
jgi:hypothetical protein